MLAAVQDSSTSEMSDVSTTDSLSFHRWKVSRFASGGNASTGRIGAHASPVGHGGHEDIHLNTKVQELRSTTRMTRRMTRDFSAKSSVQLDVQGHQRRAGEAMNQAVNNAFSSF